MVSKEELRGMCFNPDGSIKPKAECRAEMINRIILDMNESMDIDQAESYVDKSLLEFHLWGGPRLEDLLRDDDPTESMAS